MLRSISMNIAGYKFSTYATGGFAGDTRASPTMPDDSYSVHMIETMSKLVRQQKLMQEWAGKPRWKKRRSGRDELAETRCDEISKHPFSWMAIGES